MSIREQAAAVLSYGPPRILNTRLGPRSVRLAKANRKFWDVFIPNQHEAHTNGLTVRKDEHGIYWVSEWTVIEHRSTIPDHIQQLLLKWQPPAVERLQAILGRHQFALDLSDAGVGKTAVACALAAIRGRPLAVVCAKYARSQWRWMANRFGCEIYGIEHWEMVRANKTHLGRFEKMQVQLKTKTKEVPVFVWNKQLRQDQSLLVIDEIHNCGGIDTLQSMMAVGTKQSCITTLGISATAADTPVRMQALAYLLGMISHPNVFWGWAYKYGCQRNSYNQLTFGNPKDQNIHQFRAQVMQRLHREISDGGRTVRIRKADIPNFPLVYKSVEAIDCDGAEDEIARHYTEIRRVMEQMGARIIKAVEAREMIIANRQQIELLKVPTVVTMVKELIAEGKQVVIFVNYRETCIQLGKALKVPVLIGGQSTAEREAAMRDFQNGKHRAAPSTYGAGSESINLHDELGLGEREALMFPTFRAQFIEQGMNRIHRATSKSGCVVRFLFAAGTIEEETMDNLRHRLNQLNCLNDGDTIPLPEADRNDD